VNDASLPVRALKKNYDWGAAGGYTFEQYDGWATKRTVLSCLEVASRGFKDARERERLGWKDPVTGESVMVTESEVLEEKKRRREMAALRKELYGAVSGKLEGDPEWDDVVPIPQEEPEAALASISYSSDYAEGKGVF